MLVVTEDTIVAIATAIGEGGIGVIRLSGSAAISIGDALFKGIRERSVSSQLSYSVAYGHIIDLSGVFIDEVLLLVMRGPLSYTREDIVEIHCHGGPIPLKRILELCLQAGARLAEPGEFTKRAFLNGRIDLSQAEAVIDVIRAKTNASLRMAVNHLGGLFSNKVKNFRNEILRLIAHLEAAIDFPEEDVEEIAAQEVAVSVKDLESKVIRLLNTAQTGRILRDGLKTVIIGKPNVGKSSLMNMLLGENRSIVTDIPGTTRDTIEEYVNIAGIPLKIVDTAGIRETGDVVELIGVKRAKDVIAEADLILVLLDSSSVLSDEDRQVLRLLEDKVAVVLINKTDLPSIIDMELVRSLVPGMNVIRISALEGTGIDELERFITELVYSGLVAQYEGSFVNNVRHVHILEQVQKHLGEVLITIENQMPSDCIVVDLRAAWEKLGEIIGETVGEDIIDQIFSQFCIGK
jgi:tRNA modification GTPase